MTGSRSSTVRRGAALVVGSLLLSGCGGTPAGGDPGGRRLKELASDPVFAAAPDGATGVQTTLTKAKYVKPGFSGGAWHGPGVLVTFTSTAPPADVYAFYDRRAQDAGWHPTASGGLGLTDRWAKTYDDGASATLVLVLLTRSDTATERKYELAGSIALPAS